MWRSILLLKSTCRGLSTMETPERTKKLRWLAILIVNVAIVCLYLLYTNEKDRITRSSLETIHHVLFECHLYHSWTTQIIHFCKNIPRLPPFISSHHPPTTSPYLTCSFIAPNTRNMYILSFCYTQYNERAFKNLRGFYNTEIFQYSKFDLLAATWERDHRTPNVERQPRDKLF